MTPHQQENFERAFSGGYSGCTRQCHCGKSFYDAVNQWDFEEGEIERLQSTGAIPLDHSVGSVSFEGRDYVDGCHCWHGRASVIIQFLDSHAQEIARFLTLEKEQRTIEAEQSPVVG